MNGIDIAVIVCVSVLVAGVMAYLLYRKAKHKGGGGCCGRCSECDMCAHAKHDNKKAKKIH